MELDQREPVNAPSPEEPQVIFDPAKLAAQLSELLELYLARAKEALLEEQMSSREAVACAKQVEAMLDDTQSGKLAVVDTSTEWPRLDFTPTQYEMRVRRAHQPGSSPTIPRITGGTPALPTCAPIESLESAVYAVCQYDPETAILEPWAQLLARMNKLTQRLSADVEEWKASCEESSSKPESRLSSRDSVRGEESRLEDLPALAAGRDSSLITASSAGACPPRRVASPGVGRVGRADQPGSSAPAAENGGAGDGGAGVGGTGDGGAGVPPAIGGHPEPSAPDGGAQVPALQKNPSVQQPTTNGQQPPSGHT